MGALGMDPVRLRQLHVITQIRRLVKSGEDFTWIELLEHIGISESEYLEYGAIWRDIGSAGSGSFEHIRCEKTTKNFV